MSADQGRLLEAELNKTLAPGALKINVVFIPVSRGELLPALLEGRGDVVMGNLTITPERQKQVDFVDPLDRQRGRDRGHGTRRAQYRVNR